MGKGLTLFRCRMKSQVLINGGVRAPGEDAIERMEGAKQLCPLKFSSPLRPSVRTQVIGEIQAQPLPSIS